MSKPLLWAALLALALAPPAAAQRAWTVNPDWVRAHASYLAGPALRGRGSATRDEALAAGYVASQFRGFGLVHAPGMTSYLQTAEIVQVRLTGAPGLTVDGVAQEAPSLLIGSLAGAGGKLSLFAGSDPAALSGGEAVLATSPDADAYQLYVSARAKGVRLLILPESDSSRALLGRIGGMPRMPAYLADAPPPQRTIVITLPGAAAERLAGKVGAEVAVTLPVVRDVRTTTNAIGYLPGTDPRAGIILYTAHLDHLGVRPDGVVMPGANDDASGTVAVLELAHALAAGKPMRRGILFVCYGSEEIGGYGSGYFAAHPPVPLAEMVANIEFEMIGAQDPQLPAGTLMMTGFERSNLGDALKAHGALVAADPYPDEHFFERSDNYQLALEGIVAHTVSGWAVTPTYHQSSDTYESLDIAFMTRAIQSLIAPARSLADSDFKPEWKPGGKP